MITSLPYRIVLASNSPRRRELLAGLGIPFTTETLPDIDESYPGTLQGEEIPLYIAQHKADAYRSTLSADTLLITADTIVWLNGTVYGKPRDRADAIAMLQALSGKVHEVITGVSLCTTNYTNSFAVTSKVSFATLSLEEITYYVDTYRPYDKAGSYGVQEWIGYVAVEHIEGSFYNVMGLPIHRLYRELQEITQTPLL